MEASAGILIEHATPLLDRVGKRLRQLSSEIAAIEDALGEFLHSLDDPSDLNVEKMQRLDFVRQAIADYASILEVLTTQNDAAYDILTTKLSLQDSKDLVHTSEAPGVSEPDVKAASGTLDLF